MEIYIFRSKQINVGTHFPVSHMLDCVLNVSQQVKPHICNSNQKKLALLVVLHHKGLTRMTIVGPNRFKTGNTALQNV